MAGRRLRLVLVAAAIAALAGRAARAQPKPEDAEATPHFERGAEQYNLGRYAEAITEFETAYEIAPSPILLFNIAQCHRHLGNKERALFLYRRYIEQAPRAANRAEVDRRVSELEEAVRQEHAARRPAPAAPVSTGIAVRARAPARPPENERRWAVAAYGAPSVINFSRHDIDNGAVLFAARLAGSYGGRVGPTELQVSLEPQLALLPFKETDTGDRRRSWLWGALLSGRCLFRATPRLGLGAGAGAGVLWWSGVGAHNPFTADGQATAGAVPLPTLEVGPRLEVDLPASLFIALAPDFVLSRTTTAALSDALAWVWRFDLSLGAGYAF